MAGRQRFAAGPAQQVGLVGSRANSHRDQREHQADAHCKQAVPPFGVSAQEVQRAGDGRGERHVDQHLHDGGVGRKDQREERPHDHQGTHHANRNLASASPNNVGCPEEKRQSCTHGDHVQCGEPPNCRQHGNRLGGE